MIYSDFILVYCDIYLYLSDTRTVVNNLKTLKSSGL